MVFGINHHAGYFSGSDRVANKPRRVIAVGNNVNLLATKLLHHGLHTRTFDADAGAHRINVSVARADCDLAARTSLTGRGLDPHDLLVDLGHFLLEQLLKQALVSTRQDDLRAARVLLDIDDVGHDAIADAVVLTHDLLTHGQDRLSLAEVHDDVAALEATDDAGNQLALAIAVFVKGVLALGFADALNDDLLGGLRSNAAKALYGVMQVEDVAIFLLLLGGLVRLCIRVKNLEQQLITDLGPELLAIGISLLDVATAHARLLGDNAYLKQVDLPALLVKLRLELALQAEDLLRGSQDGLLESLDKDLLIDPFVLPYLLEHHRKVRLHGFSFTSIAATKQFWLWSPT